MFEKLIAWSELSVLALCGHLLVIISVHKKKM